MSSFELVDLKSDIRKLKENIDSKRQEVPEYIKKYSLRNQANKNKIFKLELIMILTMLMALISIFVLFMGSLYSLYEKDLILFICSFELLAMLILWLSYVKECRKE